MQAGSQTHYRAITIALHWIMLLLIVAVYATMELREYYPRGSDPRVALKTWHFMLGLSVLLFVGVRLAARFGAPAPPIVPAPSRWQAGAAHLAHALLYLFMFAMPVLGWLALSADGEPVPFFGLTLPALTGPSEALAERVEEVHETIGTIGYFLIGLHALAALVHHYVFRDNALARMLPRRR